MKIFSTLPNSHCVSGTDLCGVVGCNNVGRVDLKLVPILFFIICILSRGFVCA
jgi:hypothetical protein